MIVFDKELWLKDTVKTISNEQSEQEKIDTFKVCADAYSLWVKDCNGKSVKELKRKGYMFSLDWLKEVVKDER